MVDRPRPGGAEPAASARARGDHRAGRGRPLRDKIVVRAIAVDRAFHCVVLAALGFGLLAFVEHRDELRGPVYRVLADLHGGAIAGGEHGRTGLLGDIDRAFSLQSSQVELFAAVILVYAVVEGVEAVGLWRERRWAEYLTLVVTASLLPLEIYELAHRVSPFKVDRVRDQCRRGGLSPARQAAVRPARRRGSPAPPERRRHRLGRARGRSSWSRGRATARLTPVNHEEGLT